MRQKLCDAADWLDPEFDRIARDELREIPRFHRKQWEFVQIFRALRDAGVLAPDRIGLSMGAGRERVLYAIASHVAKLTVTDLYRSGTTWDCAETDDPEAWVKSDMPIPCDPDRIAVDTMDMTSLRFPEGTFDFCYSSCAIEHIGGREAFLRHLNEVARVLRPGGVYVFTTEMAYQHDTCENPGNYLFSPGYLSDLIADSDLAAETAFDASIWPHQVNYPRPANIARMLSPGDGALQDAFVDQYAHLQLLQGNIPFTSGLLCARKRAGRLPIVFDGFEDARRFMSEGAAAVRRMIEDSTLTPNPFSGIEGQYSPCCQEHEAHRAARRPPAVVPHLLHTEYCWLGSRRRAAELRMEVARGPACDVTIGVNRYRALTPWLVEAVMRETLRVSGPGRVTKTVEIDCDERYCYAYYAIPADDALRVSEVAVTVHPAQAA